MNMQQYIEADSRLATLLGWEQIEILNQEVKGSFVYWGLCGRKTFDYTKDKVDVPSWCLNSRPAFELMVEHVEAIFFRKQFVELGTGGEFKSVLYSDHPDKETAIRFAVVQAVIFKLEIILTKPLKE